MEIATVDSKKLNINKKILLFLLTLWNLSGKYTIIIASNTHTIGGRMRMLKYLLPFVAVVAVSSGFAAVSYSAEDYDVNALRQVEKNKSTVNVLNKGNNLFISGDVRAKWERLEREARGNEELGSGAQYVGAPGLIYAAKPNNIFLSEVNLLVNYDASCAWAQVKLNFQNSMGTESGTNANIRVERAFVGYDFVHGGETEIYAEVGRQKMDYLFESEVQFNSTYDGFILGYDYSWEGAGDFFVHGGAFIVDNMTNHYGWVGEVGAMEIFDTGLYMKYSYIHWEKNGVTTGAQNTTPATPAFAGVVDNYQYRYDVNQLTVGYAFRNSTFSFPARVYAAGLYNSAARKEPISNNQKLPWAWYAGFEIGKLEVAGDWAFNINYQWVQFNAIPSVDVAGIGRGYDSSPYITNDSAYLVDPTSQVTGAASPATVEGNTNYKGVEATGFYNVTTNLALRACFKTSTPVTKAIGGSHMFRDFELGVIYSF
ncbi:MAG: hypothetical protein JHC93_04035 [Parachlamydiales bacterium]|nr:hypothetical protein [Parachlamydiales bacterium]